MVFIRFIVRNRLLTINYGFFANVPTYGPGAYGLTGPFSLPVFPINVQITIESPTNGSLVPVGTGTSIVAQLKDPQQIVTNVEFIVNGSKLSEGSTTNFTWTPEIPGNYALQLVADTLVGQSISSGPVKLTANYPFAAEGVDITYPYDGEQIYVGVPTTIALDFDDFFGLFDHAEFFANNVSLGQTTNTVFIWVPSVPNTYYYQPPFMIFLEVLISTTNLVAVQAMPPPPPVVTITAPSNGGVIMAGASTTIIANVDDPGLLTTNLQLYVDELKVSDNTNQFVWTPTQLGSHALQAAILTSDGTSL